MRKTVADVPALAHQWDHERNYPLQPEAVSWKSSKKYWWVCGRGHRWQATANNRANGYGCPYCSGRLAVKGETDLETICPDLAREWDYQKNDPLKPDAITPKSNIKVWWICKRGHSWQESPVKRQRGDGCPFCSGHRVAIGENDLWTISPELSEEWNYDRNYPLTPKNITKRSSKKVWWKCKKGHEWQATVVHRSDGSGCPFCSGRYPIKGETDLETINPLLAAEWDYEKNGETSPSDIAPNSEKRVWWKCPICQYSWKAKPAARNFSGTGCPRCNKRNRTSFPEQAIFFYAQRHFPDAVNSFTDIFNNGMELDIFIPSMNLGIEYDGPMHRGKVQDTYKYRICKNHGIKLIRVSEISRGEIAALCDHFILVDCTDRNRSGLDATITTLLTHLGISNPDIDVSRDRSLIYSQYLSRLRTNSLASKHPLLATEWHTSKNEGLTPEMFNANSAEKVWWKCSVCGHEWQARIYSRTRGETGCPICGFEKSKQSHMKTLLSGNNTLIAKFPAIAKEWDYAKNYGIDISHITPGSNKRVWWKCSHGHSWQAVVRSRTRGAGCPYCSGRYVEVGKTDLASTMPEIVTMWNFEKNRAIMPSSFMPHSNVKVWWRCKRGHEWQAAITSVVSGRRCPYCSGRKVLKGFNDLATLRPDLLPEWNYEKNIGVLPSDFTEHSGKKVWWKCSAGHEWIAVIDSRSKGHGCPICAKEAARKKRS